MTPETAIAAFGLITFATIGFEIMYTYATRGLAFGFSSQRPIVEKSGFALRVERVYRNQVESAAYILPALLTALYTQASIPALATVLLLIVLGRAGFVLMFYSGITFIRVPFFVLGSFGSLYILIMALISAP